MIHSDFNGNPTPGVLLTSLTVILYVINLSTISSIAGICTIAAALTTIAVNLKRFFKRK